MKSSISSRLTGLHIFGFFGLITIAASQSVSAMSMPNHLYGLGDLGGMTDLVGTPICEGGAGLMTYDQIRRVGSWMDNPSLKTGQYKNQLAGGGGLCPANHNSLRHNPVKVAKVFSGDGSVHPGVLNVARTHKLQDIAHNSRPVDGVVITGPIREESKAILRHVQQNKQLPEKLPAWVDNRGPSISSPKASGKAVSANIGKGGKALAVVAVVASPIQAYDGVKEIQQGQTVKGSLNLAGSAANATSAVAGLAGRGLLSGGAGAVGAGVDGVIDLYNGYQNNDKEKLTIGGVKSAAAIAMGAGTATIQPEVVIPAAIVYGGAVVTDIVYENREAIGESLHVASESAKVSAANGYKKSKQCLSNTTDLTVEACAIATESIRGSLNDSAMVAYNYTPECIKNNGLFQKSMGWFHGF